MRSPALSSPPRIMRSIFSCRTVVSDSDRRKASAEDSSCAASWDAAERGAFACVARVLSAIEIKHYTEQTRAWRSLGLVRGNESVKPGRIVDQHGVLFVIRAEDIQQGPQRCRVVGLVPGGEIGMRPVHSPNDAFSAG